MHFQIKIKQLKRQLVFFLISQLTTRSAKEASTFHPNLLVSVSCSADERKNKMSKLFHKQIKLI